jgi:hypothetical protein
VIEFDIPEDIKALRGRVAAFIDEHVLALEITRKLEYSGLR